MSLLSKNPLKTKQNVLKPRRPIGRRPYNVLEDWGCYSVYDDLYDYVQVSAYLRSKKNCNDGQQGKNTHVHWARSKIFQKQKSLQIFVFLNLSFERFFHCLLGMQYRHCPKWRTL